MELIVLGLLCEYMSILDIRYRVHHQNKEVQVVAYLILRLSQVILFVTMVMLPSIWVEGQLFMQVMKKMELKYHPMQRIEKLYR